MSKKKNTANHTVTAVVGLILIVMIMYVLKQSSSKQTPEKQPIEVEFEIDSSGV
ncbi:MAG: hypothetical protein H6607_09730 [Flavobacteriales bacterium]|nr:hypothetical protein [Flavobacteriales bacterium]